jgi:hypothetical protein
MLPCYASVATERIMATKTTRPFSAAEQDRASHSSKEMLLSTDKRELTSGSEIGLARSGRKRTPRPSSTRPNQPPPMTKTTCLLRKEP